MKTFYWFVVAAALLCVAAPMPAQTVLFNQTFSTAFADIGVSNTATLLTSAEYINTTSPSISQFTAIGTTASTGGVSHVSCDGSALAFGRGGGGSGYAMQDTGAAFGSGVGAVIVKFDFNPTGLIKQSSSSPKVTFQFLVGAMSSADRASAPSFSAIGAAATAYFTIGAFDASTFYVNNSFTANVSPAHSYATTQTIRFIVNNTSASIPYTGPDATSQTVAAGTYDLWVGTTKEYDDNAVSNTANVIKGFRIGLGNSGGSSTTTHACAIDNLNITSLSGGTSVDQSPGALPTGFALLQNYPNPFNPSTMISYSASRSAHIRISVLNVLGQEVERLVDGVRSAGLHRIQFNADAHASGIYFVRMTAGGEVTTKAIHLVR